MDSAFSTTGWAELSDDQQLHVTRAALGFAIRTVAGQAEMLAGEMENGCLLDRGGADALRLLASALRISTDDNVSAMACAAPDLASMAVAGHG